VMDPMDTIRADMSWHGTLHGIFGGIVFTLMPVSCFVFLRSFQSNPKYRSLKWATLTAGIIITAAVILLTVATKFPATREMFHQWLGLIQRASLIPFMIWLFFVALVFYSVGSPEIRPVKS